MTKTLVTIREAARVLGVHENTIRNWIDQGKVEAVPIPGGSGFKRVVWSSIEPLIPRDEAHGKT